VEIDIYLGRGGEKERGALKPLSDILFSKGF
jgi:hypothetical protein